MSDERHETVADIMREMRTLGRLDEKSTDKIPRSLQALGLRTYVDRIEAAEMRERDATRDKSSQVGNAEKMLEALQKIVLITVKAGMSIRFDVACGIIASTARCALAAPPRNCDVGTAEEQEERHNRWCKSMKQRTECCWVVGCRKCFIKWSQMPYDEGGAKK